MASTTEQEREERQEVTPERPAETREHSWGPARDVGPFTVTDDDLPSGFRWINEIRVCTRCHVSDLAADHFGWPCATPTGEPRA